MGVKKILLKESYQNKVEEIVDFLELNLNYEFKLLSDYYTLVGSGQSAFVFDVPDTNKVIRISEPIDKRIVDNYDKLLGKKFDHVVNVYMNRSIGGNHFIQVFEKLERIDKYYKQTLDVLADSLGDGEVYYNYHELVATEGEHYEDLMEVEEIVLDVQRGIEELESIDVYHSDIWSDNIMQDVSTGNYKLIDIT